MPKCIIAGKDTAQKTFQSDSSDLYEYFELGWEVTSTFLEVYYLRKAGVYQKEDILVTVSGREFLYRPLFDKVIDYKTYLESKPPYPTIDLVTKTNRLYNSSRRYVGWRALDRKIQKWRILLHHRRQYRQRYKKIFDKKDIVNSSLAAKQEESYLCVCLRLRQHHPGRNIPEAYCLELLEALKDRTCFVVGLGIEHLVTQPKHRVCSLEEFATLAASEKCECVIGSMTGTMQLAHLVHPNKLIAIDFENGHARWNQTVPCVLNDYANLGAARHHIYTYLPSVKEMVDDLNGKAGPSRIKKAHLKKKSYQKMMEVDRRRGHAFYEFPAG